MITEQEVILLGTLARTHGKQGDLQVNYVNDLLPDADPEFVVLSLSNIFTPFRLLDWREKGAESYILTLDGVESEEKAQSLCGTEVYLLRRDLTDNPDEDVLTLEDMVGFDVEDVHAGPLGKIVEVDESTINALFLLENDNVIPAHDDFVVDINYTARKLIVNLPEGLLG